MIYSLIEYYTECETVHLRPLSDEEKPVSEAYVSYPALTLVSVNGSVEPMLPSVEYTTY